MTALESLNMDIAERIKQRMGEMGLKAVDIVKKTGLSKGTISQWLNGHTQPRGDNLLLLAETLGTSPEWLQFGVMSAVGLDSEPSYKAYDVPVLDAELSAGFGRHLETEAVLETIPVPERMLQELGVNAESACIVSVRGDSMETTLRDGEKVVVNTSEKQPVSNGIYAFEFDGELKVKRFIKRFDSTWTISSDNKHDPAYQDQTVSAHNVNQLRVIGRVAGVLARRL